MLEFENHTRFTAGLAPGTDKEGGDRLTVVIKGTFNLREGAEALNIEKDEPIHICTGYILSEVRKALYNEGYNVIPSRIVGETQELAEDEFIKHLSRLGVGKPNYVKELRGFNNFLTWVLRDVDKRERFVKTGWKAWPRLKTGEKVDSKQAKE